MVTRRSLLAAMLLLPAVGMAYDNNPLAGLDEPARVLREGVETLTGYLGKNPNANPAQLEAYLNEKIAPYFDFERMAYWTAGPIAGQLNPRQQAQLQQMLRARFLTAMAEQLSGYRYSRIQYMRPKGNPYQGNVTLGIRVYSQIAPPVQIDFKLYRGEGEGGWRVYDVVANGVSAVNYYRNEFSGIVRQYGVDGLIARVGP